MDVIKRNGLNLRYIENQTYELCLEAVRENGLALEYVKNKTDEICYEAVRQYPIAISYVENQTEELCRMAVKLDDSSIKYIKNQTKELCLQAIKANIRNLGYCNNNFLNYFVREFDMKSFNLYSLDDEVVLIGYYDGKYYAEYFDLNYGIHNKVVEAVKLYEDELDYSVNEDIYRKYLKDVGYGII